jgi:hypothetical protein
VLELRASDSSTPRIAQSIFNYNPQYPYGITVVGKVSPGATGVYRVVDVTANSVLAEETFTNSESMRSTRTRFTTPEAGHELKFELYLDNSANGHKAFVSSVVLGQITDMMVNESMILNPLLRFVNAVYQDAGLHSAYKDAADDYLSFAREEVIPKYNADWRQISGTDGGDNGTGVYVFKEGLGSELFSGRSLPHNQYLSFSRLLYQVYDATEGNPLYATERMLYLSRANDMNRAFKTKLVPHANNAR